MFQNLYEKKTWQFGAKIPRQESQKYRKYNARKMPKYVHDWPNQMLNETKPRTRLDKDEKKNF